MSWSQVEPLPLRLDRCHRCHRCTICRSVPISTSCSATIQLPIGGYKNMPTTPMTIDAKKIATKIHLSARTNPPGRPSSFLFFTGGANDCFASSSAISEPSQFKASVPQDVRNAVALDFRFTPHNDLCGDLANPSFGANRRHQ